MRNLVEAVRGWWRRLVWLLSDRASWDYVARIQAQNESLLDQRRELREEVEAAWARVAELEAAQSWRRGVVEHLSLALRDHDLEMCRNLIGQLLREVNGG